MQSRHDAAHARPTAEWINRYAAELLAAKPGMHPLDAVRQAMEATAGAAEDRRHEQRPSGEAVQRPAGRNVA